MRVAVTGATGFLGIRLVRGLLARYPTVTILVRRQPADALALIERTLLAAGEQPDIVSDLLARIEVWRADMSRPRFGMSETQFAELAADLEVLWHSAGDTTLVADPDTLRATNVEGVRGALALVQAGPRKPMLYHVSTAFVAGRRAFGTIYDDELTDSYGFETPYERSKYEAEMLVRHWQRRTGRPVVILRPSILTTDLPYDPALPKHPMIDSVQSLDAVIRAVVRAGLASPGRRRARFSGNPDAQLNLIPVEDAAETMLRLADSAPRKRLETYHVVHPEEIAAAEVLRALGERIDVELELVRSLPDPDPVELRLNMLGNISAYVKHQRRYDDARVRALLRAAGPPTEIDYHYVLRGVSGARLGAGL